MEKLVARFKSDKAFAEKYAKLDSLDKMLNQANADGFELTKEDLRAYVKPFHKGALSDEDAAAVAGGETPEEKAKWIADFKEMFREAFKDFA
jgi:predicted ribosomally synthesized peptide with nif11-like leader